uniref:Uncharacterized protein n=1 Tax=Arundo donax TaxID=35708 RepID=A0A0A8Z9B0_ARUDO
MMGPKLTKQGKPSKVNV